jgi:hypothetical protein
MVTESIDLVLLRLESASSGAAPVQGDAASESSPSRLGHANGLGNGLTMAWTKAYGAANTTGAAGEWLR